MIASVGSGIGFMLRVVVSTAFVLGLIKLLEYYLTKTGRVGIPRKALGAEGRREPRLRLVESLVLPGGIVLYIVSYSGRELLLAASKAGLQLVEVEDSSKEQ